MIVLRLALVYFFSQPVSFADAPMNTKPQAKPQNTSTQRLNELYDANIYILKHQQIEVESYDPVTNTYHLMRPDVPKAKDLYTTPKDLAGAVSTLKLETLLKRPQSPVGIIFVTDENLPLLVHDEGDGYPRAGLPVIKKARSRAKQGQ